MPSVVTLEGLLNTRRVWRGPAAVSVSDSCYSTGLPELDAALPGGGWPGSALSEILVTEIGTGELRLLWPALARLTKAGERVVLIGPDHQPYPQAWLAAGVDLKYLSIVRARSRDVLWAAEQCLRSGSCGAVVCWPRDVDDRSLRRLQVAAETGQTLAFTFRPIQASLNASPAAVRLAVDTHPVQLRVLKCRGGIASARPIAAGWQ